MDSESKDSAFEFTQDVDFIKEDVQSRVSKPLVSRLILLSASCFVSELS